MKRIYKIGNYVFFIFMGILLLGGICLNTSQIERVPLINLLIGTSVVTILLFLIYLIYQKLTSKKIITKKKEIIIVVVISIILISLLSVTAYLLRNYGTSDFDFNNNYEWDFKVAVGYINSVVDKKDLSSANFLEYLNYRTIYSNLDGIIMVVMPIYYIFRAFGVTSLILPGIVVNIIFIYLSLLFSYAPNSLFIISSSAKI